MATRKAKKSASQMMSDDQMDRMMKNKVPRTMTGRMMAGMMDAKKASMMRATTKKPK